MRKCTIVVHYMGDGQEHYLAHRDLTVVIHRLKTMYAVVKVLGVRVVEEGAELGRVDRRTAYVDTPVGKDVYATH